MATKIDVNTGSLMFAIIGTIVDMKDCQRGGTLI